MVVILIILIMSGMGVLSIRGILPGMRAERASSRLAYQLQLARSEAIAGNLMAQVTLDVNTNVYECWLDANRNASREDDEVTSIQLADPNQVSLRSGWNTGMFNAFGQFILTPGQREIRTVTTNFYTEDGAPHSELILRGSGAITKR